MWIYQKMLKLLPVFLSAVPASDHTEALLNNF